MSQEYKSCELVGHLFPPNNSRTQKFGLGQALPSPCPRSRPQEKRRVHLHLGPFAMLKASRSTSLACQTGVALRLAPMICDDILEEVIGGWWRSYIFGSTCVGLGYCHCCQERTTFVVTKNEKDVLQHYDYIVRELCGHCEVVP